MNLLKQIFVLLFLSGILFSACGTKKQTTKPDTPQLVVEKGISNDCPADINCTMDFRSIAISVVDTAGNPVELDSYKALIAGTNQELKSIDKMDMGGGKYIIADDNSMSLVGKNGKEVQFIGNLDGKTVINYNLLIGHDCCHIKLLRGETKVILRL